LAGEGRGLKIDPDEPGYYSKPTRGEFTMKREYVKPLLVKRERLSAVTANGAGISGVTG
jgi:hypothetical protein